MHTNKNRTEEEIKRQIDGLELEKSKLPAFSAFGTPNHEMIDAKISILSGQKGLENYDEGDWEEVDTNNEIYRAAEEASEWLLGDRDEDLFE